MGRQHPAEPRDHLVTQVGRLDDAHLRTVRGEFVGEDVHVDVRNAEPLPGGDRAPAEAERRLGARGDLDEGLLAGGELVESREGPLPRVLAGRHVERGLRDLDVGGDAREEERAVALLVEVEPVDVPAGLVFDERERLDAATVGGGVARLDVVERHDATELAGALERNERRLAQIEAR